MAIATLLIVRFFYSGIFANIIVGLISVGLSLPTLHHWAQRGGGLRLLLWAGGPGFRGTIHAAPLAIHGMLPA